METVQMETEWYAVKRLIRCEKTGRYFHKDAWTDDPQEATDFPDEVSVVRACVENDLYEVELVLRAGSADLFCTEIR